MAPRNPSELCRLEEELSELKAQLKDCQHWGKIQRMATLQQIREIERILDIESKPYSSGEF